MGRSESLVVDALRYSLLLLYFFDSISTRTRTDGFTQAALVHPMPPRLLRNQSTMAVRPASSRAYP